MRRTVITVQDTLYRVGLIAQQEEVERGRNLALSVDSSAESHFHALSHLANISHGRQLSGMGKLAVQFPNLGVFELTSSLVLFRPPLVE